MIGDNAVATYFLSQMGRVAPSFSLFTSSLFSGTASVWAVLPPRLPADCHRGVFGCASRVSFLVEARGDRGWLPDRVDGLAALCRGSDRADQCGASKSRGSAQGVRRAGTAQILNGPLTRFGVVR